MNKKAAAKLEEYKSQSLPVENNNEVVHKWVKAIDELPTAKEKKYANDNVNPYVCIRAKGLYFGCFFDVDKKQFSIKYQPEKVAWGESVFKEYNLEWLKEIKPVPQSLPISNVDAIVNAFNAAREELPEVSIEWRIAGKPFHKYENAQQYLLSLQPPPVDSKDVDEAAEIKCYNHLKYVYDRYSIDWDESDSAKVAMVLFELEKNIMGEEIIESLEEAAENYASKPYYRNGGTLSVAPQLYLKRGFIAGVKWYASQLNRTDEK